MASSDNGRGFPEDLAREILLRLPVKSLLRFKCCCKNWYALIKNPTFINQHLYCSNKNKEPHLLIYDFEVQDPMVTLIDSYGTAVQDPDNYFQCFRGMSRLVGSVDGLFLLESSPTHSIDISLALWNPATREVRPLPAAQFNRIASSELSRVKYIGFGLDPLTNDYKVVCFRTFYDERLITRHYAVCAAVYSCSGDSWRIFSPTNYKISIYRSCYESRSTAYLNGAYYWLLSPGFDCDPNWKILSFDFSKEVFEEIEVPDGSRFDLVLLDDSVALLHYIVNTGEYEIWVMIQPGVWNKLLIFQCFQILRSWYSTTAILLTKYCPRLISYNVKTKEMRRLGFPHRNLTNTYTSVYCYKESLVSIRRSGDAELNHSLQLTRNIELLD